MNDTPILHVRVIGGRKEVLRIRDEIDSESPPWNEYDIVVSNESMELAEVPALDEYADELAERIAEKLNQ